MKKLLIVVLFVLSNIIFAHNGNISDVNLRQWTISENNYTFEGSFCLFKNGKVFIEDANHKMLEIPLNSFSKKDQNYIIERDLQIAKLNEPNITSVNETVTNSQGFEFKFGLIVLIFLMLSRLDYKFTNTKKLKYIFPILGIALLAIFFGFKQNSTESLLIATNPLYIDSAFAPFKPKINTFWNGNYFYVESKGIPDHLMMVGISSNGWQQQVPIPQCYIGNNAWPVPLSPVVSTSPVAVDQNHFTRGAIAIAVNGVPIFNPYTNAGVDAFITGQLDNFGGHCGRADDYHYHTAPLHLYSLTTTTLPIAFAFDGFAVYGSVEPDGAPMLTLDANHGHYRNGIYHYHGTTAAPYMIGKMVGQVTEDNTNQIIPQATASPVRPGQDPLPGALITACQPNVNNNGYVLTYSLSGQTHTVDYKWTLSGQYTFNFISPSSSTTSTYNGFSQCTVPISVKEISGDANSFIVYPNPARGNLNLKLGNDITENEILGISIYNLGGDLIFKTEKYSESIDIHQLAHGTYLLKIQLPEFVLTRKLIVQ